MIRWKTTYRLPKSCFHLVLALKKKTSTTAAQPQLETPGREKEQADWILLLTVPTLGI